MTAKTTTRRELPKNLNRRHPAWELVHRFPNQGEWTLRHYLAIDNACHYLHSELANGRLEILPMPTQSHQLILVLFMELLKAFTAVYCPGVVLPSGVRIRIRMHTG